MSFDNIRNDQQQDIQQPLVDIQEQVEQVERFSIQRQSIQSQLNNDQNDIERYSHENSILNQAIIQPNNIQTYEGKLKNMKEKINKLYYNIKDRHCYGCMVFPKKRSSQDKLRELSKFYCESPSLVKIFKLVFLSHLGTLRKIHKTIKILSPYQTNKLKLSDINIFSKEYVEKQILRPLIQNNNQLFNEQEIRKSELAYCFKRLSKYMRKQGKYFLFFQFIFFLTAVLLTLAKSSLQQTFTIIMFASQLIINAFVFCYSYSSISNLRLSKVNCSCWLQIPFFLINIGYVVGVLSFQGLFGGYGDYYYEEPIIFVNFYLFQYNIFQILVFIVYLISQLLTHNTLKKIARSLQRMNGLLYDSYDELDYSCIY